MKIIENSVPKQTENRFLYMEASHVSLNQPIMGGNLYSMWCSVVRELSLFYQGTFVNLHYPLVWEQSMPWKTKVTMLMLFINHLLNRAGFGICSSNGLGITISDCGVVLMSLVVLHWKIWVFLCGLQRSQIIQGSLKVIVSIKWSTNFLWPNLVKYEVSMLLTMDPRWSFDNVYHCSHLIFHSSLHPSCFACCRCCLF